MYSRRKNGFSLLGLTVIVCIVAAVVFLLIYWIRAYRKQMDDMISQSEYHGCQYDTLCFIHNEKEAYRKYIKDKYGYVLTNGYVLTSNESYVLGMPAFQKCPAGGVIDVAPLGSLPRCSIHGVLDESIFREYLDSDLIGKAEREKQGSDRLTSRQSTNDVPIQRDSDSRKNESDPKPE